MSTKLVVDFKIGEFANSIIERKEGEIKLGETTIAVEIKEDKTWVGLYVNSRVWHECEVYLSHLPLLSVLNISKSDDVIKAVIKSTDEVFEVYSKLDAAVSIPSKKYKAFLKHANHEI